MRMRWYVLLFVYAFAQAETPLYEVLKQRPLSTQYTISEPVSIPLTSFFPLPPNEDYVPLKIDLNEKIPSHYGPIVDDTIYLQTVMLSSIGMLALLPESVTNWSEAKLKDQSLWNRWKEHVSTAPVWDQDDWVINYIGHPVSGAYYYTMARNDGMSISESAAFSTLMSTFFWEYGYEAFAEVPSIQDLIFTPLLGSILGEELIILQNKLDDNGGSLWGSKNAGNIAYFFIDPLGHIAQGLETILISLGFDPTVTMKIYTYPYVARIREFPFPKMAEHPLPHDNRQYGVVITIE